MLAFALLAAFGLGVGAGAGSPNAKTTTVSRTVTETRTETATLAQSQTVVQTPAACRNAIKTARQAFTAAGLAFGIASGDLPLIGQAAEAGAASDATKLNQITAKLESDTKKVNGVAGTLSRLAIRFNAAAASCG